MTYQLVHEVAYVLALPRELDCGAFGPGVEHPCASLHKPGHLRCGNLGHDQLAAVHIVAGEVLDLHHLDQSLQLLADLVGFGMAVVDLQREPGTARLLARADVDGTDVEAAPADDTRNPAQRVPSRHHQHRPDPDGVRHLPAPPRIR